MLTSFIFRISRSLVKGCDFLFKSLHLDTARLELSLMKQTHIVPITAAAKFDTTTATARMNESAFFTALPQKIFYPSTTAFTVL